MVTDAENIASCCIGDSIAYLITALTGLICAHHIRCLSLTCLHLYFPVYVASIARHPLAGLEVQQVLACFPALGGEFVTHA